VKRTVLVIAMGAIGILLGVGLSLAVDAISGSELSDPVPLGVVSEAATHGPTTPPASERPTQSATPGKSDDHDSVGPSEGQTGSSGPTGSNAGESSAAGSDDGSGLGDSTDASGSDDPYGDDSGHDGDD
jgi:hypothetical protein